MAHASRARHWLLAAAAAVPLACGDAEPPAVDAAPPEGVPLSGLYEVSGTTVDKTTGMERKLTGVVIVDVEGDVYSTTFDLRTNLMSGGVPQRAELIGKGEGTVSGRTLDGSAQTQLIVALVPGVDASFAMLPRGVTARIVNRSHAAIAPDGAVRIEIESEAAPGSDYAPTRTTLRGRRVAADGAGRLALQPPQPTR
jgi:hypothetical protein